MAPAPACASALARGFGHVLGGDGKPVPVEVTRSREGGEDFSAAAGARKTDAPATG